LYVCWFVAFSHPEERTIYLLLSIYFVFIYLYCTRKLCEFFVA
jgi:hypothetical protein